MRPVSDEAPTASKADHLAEYRDGPRDQFGQFIPTKAPEPDPPVTGSPEALEVIESTPTGLAVPLPPPKRHWRENNEPWERQVGEQLAPWKAFRAYRDMGEERDIRNLEGHKDVKAGRACISNWASQWKWTERLKTYDAMVDRRNVEGRVRQKILMEQRHVKQGMALQQVGMEKVADLLKPENKKKLTSLAPSTALRYVDLGVQIERQARGVDDDKREEFVVSAIDAAVKANLFDKIAAMAANIAAVRQLSPGTIINVTATEANDDAEAV
jgi:hypothetical protein